MQIIAWILTIAALYGTWLNSNQDRRGFYYWFVTDVAFAVLFIIDDMYAQATLFAIYAYLANRGLKKWMN
jgi:nicotinamide riboside transporter PnuC